MESEWADRYPSRTHMMLQAKFADVDIDQWKSMFGRVAQKSQMMFNHHIHPTDLKTGERKPLPGCLTKADPKNCRGRFPRELDVEMCCFKNVVVCPGIAKLLKLKISGKKNMLGAIIGVRNEANLNGCPITLCELCKCMWMQIEPIDIAL